MTLKQQQDRNITMLKAEFERKAGEVHKIFEKAMKTVSLSHVKRKMCVSRESNGSLAFACLQPHRNQPLLT